MLFRIVGPSNDTLLIPSFFSSTTLLSSSFFVALGYPKTREYGSLTSLLVGTKNESIGRGKLNQCLFNGFAYGLISIEYPKATSEIWYDPAWHTRFCQVIFQEIFQELFGIVEFPFLHR